MAKNKKNNKIHKVNLIGQKIGDTICKDYTELGDAVLVVDEFGTQHLYNRDSILKSPKVYQFNGEKVIEVEQLKNHSLYIFKTSKNTHFVDENNEQINGSDQWVDYYVEPYSSSFFRKDKRGRWLDIQGYLLKTPFLIIDQVLCSLNGKTSHESLFYRNQKLYVNPKCTMVQVGKMVYDTHLNLITYFGERITGLGQKNINFSNEQSVQEVHLGLSKRGFIDDITYKPYTIQREEITTHIASKKIHSFQFEEFRSTKNSYVVCNEWDRFVKYKNKSLNVAFDSYINIGTLHIIKVFNNTIQFYWDLSANGPFDPFQNGELVIEVDENPIEKGNSTLFNMKSQSKRIVFNGTEQDFFKIENDTISPDRIETVVGFEQFFYYAFVEGRCKLCSIHNDEIIKIGTSKTKISKILATEQSKLFNCEDINGRKLVLDSRFGMDQLKLATIDTYPIEEVLHNPVAVGNYMLQNARIDKLGGTVKRTINLNNEDLTVFHLPNDLKSYAEQSEPSIFAGNEVIEVTFDKPISIANKTFYKATFIDYLNEPNQVILQKNNGRPLQLDGVAHRNELVVSFDVGTLNKKYFLSEHRIIGAHTLTEDLKESQLLFSFKTMSSWMPFYDTYLPILKRIKDFEDYKEWEYHLFELHNLSKEKEYIAVEQHPPYRILADKSKSKYRPRIVKSKELVLKSPEEISAIRRFFSNPGILVDLD